MGLTLPPWTEAESPSGCTCVCYCCLWSSAWLLPRFQRRSCTPWSSTTCWRNAGDRRTWLDMPSDNTRPWNTANSCHPCTRVASQHFRVNPSNNQAQNDMLLQELAKLLLPRLRNRRQAGGLIEADESDFQEFLGNLEDFKEGMQSKISNLTCVLTQMKILDANMQPNMYQYLTGVWQELDMSEPNIAIQEPEWVQKMKNSYTDCHDLAKAWPQRSLDRNELTKKYGREMVFFKCVDKMQVQNCAKFCIKQALELWYGKDDSDWTQYGLPRDKYDASLVSMMVLDEAASPEEEFVSDFFWSKPQ